MNRRTTLLAMSIVKGSVELLMFFPPLLVLIVYALPETSSRWLWFATLPLCYMAGFAAGGIAWLHKLYRLPQSACLIAIALFHSYVWYGSMLEFAYLWPIPLLQAYRGSRTARIPWLEYFPAGYYVVGTVVYFLASVLLRYIPSFTPYEPVLTWCGIGALAITLLMMNQSNLKQETLSGKSNPALAASVMWQNRALTTLVFAAAIIFALFRQLHEALLWLKELLLTGLGLAFSALPAIPMPASGGGPPPSAPMNLGPHGEPSAWWIWLEKAALIFAYIVIAAATAFTLYRFIHMLLRLFRRMFHWLKLFLNQGEQQGSGIGYEDDVESIMDWQELRDGLAARFRGLLKGFGTREARWEDMKDNRERVRYLYRVMLAVSVKAGYRVKPYFTPKETGQELDGWDRKHPLTSQPVVSVYEKVRYGDKDVSDAEVAAARHSLEMRKE